MSAVTVIFYVFAFLAAGSAISMLFTKNVFYAALYLLVCLLSLAALYIVAFAELVAVTQLLIYAGGVMVIIIFGIMLTSKISGKPLRVQNQFTIPGILLGGTFMVLISFFISKSVFASAPTKEITSTAIPQMGILLMSTYSLPFETVGILLLVALLGAAVVAASINLKKN
jgi:NADH-quinone oxidoreductase subunit J